MPQQYDPEPVEATLQEINRWVGGALDVRLFVRVSGW
jgi:hypothetical protein